LQVLRRGAEHLHIELLPPDSDQPLDRLHNIHDHAAVGPPITDLEQDLGHFVSHGDNTPDFGIELVRAFRVNTRWAVAPESDMSPRDILALPAIGLDHTQYTLYAIGSSDPLPLDTAVPITRGQAFEAQRDGKYGAA
jgi:hypothetical protein